MLPEPVEQRLKQRIEEYEQQKHTHVPVEITIRFVSPIMAPIFPLYLDAVLGNIVAQEIWGQYYGRIPPEFFIKELPLPLKRHNFREYGYAWAASCNVVTKEAVFGTDGYKRSYPGDPWVLMKSFTASQMVDYEGSGRYKNYLESFEVTFIEEMKFYAFGNPKEINRLLSQVRFLFKKRSQGRGEIQSLSVNPIKQDFTLWKNNRPMRPIPVELIKEGSHNQYELNMSRLYPPYWGRDERVLCVVPDHDTWSGRRSLRIKPKKKIITKEKTTPYDLLYGD